jgi:hypothetical protein
LRGDLDRLAAHHPDLAARLDSIRAIIDGPEPGHGIFTTVAPGTSPMAGAAAAEALARQVQDAADLRRRKAMEWDETVAEVRRQDGFGFFLTTTPYQELAAAAQDGPIVIINASPRACHALIVRAALPQPGVIALPGLTLDVASQQAAVLQRALLETANPHQTSADRDVSRAAIRDVLAWLWDVIAEPVLTHLGCNGAPTADSAWPRVWWCPTGPLSLMPIHSAGRYPSQPGSIAVGEDCVPERVVSSYIPTLTALARARQVPPLRPRRHLTVAMPNNPELPPLPAVAAELSILAHYFPPGPGSLQLIGPQATRSAVLTAVDDCTWAHFACHDGQRPDAPDLSGFMLFDKTLTIADLAAQPSRYRDLAFLSACQTAIGSVRHPDEALHLAAALQFLGYRHVIATMWSIADSAAAKVAGSVYAALVRDDEPTAELAAVALHQATRALLHRFPWNAHIWAPYIHLGA